MPLTIMDPIVEFIHHHIDTGLPLNETESGPNHRGFINQAAQRRGLTIERLSADHVAFFNGRHTIGGMYKMVSSLVGQPAITIANSKPMTKKLFEQAGVPVAEGQEFDREDYEQALEYFRQRPVPLVIKPSNGRAGSGITTNIQTPEQFSDGWQHAIKASTKASKIMVEDHVAGLDVRAYVVGERVVAAATRLPAFVLGTGKDTVEKLVAEKTNRRSSHAYLHRMPLRIDNEWLARQNLTYSSVPDAGQVVLLNGTVNIHQGGEHVDITQELAPELQEIAVRAARAVPGLAVAGIDLLVESTTSARNAVVLEANTSANISVHHIPAYGQPVDVAAAIVDEMIRQASTETPLLETTNTSERLDDHTKGSSLGSRLMRLFRKN